MRSHTRDVRLTLSAVLGIGSKREALKPSMGLGFREGRAVLKPKCQLPLRWAAGQVWWRGDGKLHTRRPRLSGPRRQASEAASQRPDWAFFSPF